MPKLKTVLELFEQFGLAETYVKDCLTSASSPFNAFESLKLQASMAYEDMSAIDQKRLAESHKRLSSMSITNVRRESDQRETMIDNLLKLLSTCKGRYVVGDYIDWLIEFGRHCTDKRVHSFIEHLKKES